MVQLEQGTTRSQRTLRWAHRRQDRGCRPFASGGPGCVAAIAGKQAQSEVKRTVGPHAAIVCSEYPKSRVSCPKIFLFGTQFAHARVHCRNPFSVSGRPTAASHCNLSLVRKDCSGDVNSPPIFISCPPCMLIMKAELLGIQREF